MESRIFSAFSRALAKERRPLILLSFAVLIGSTFVGTLAPPDPLLRQELETLAQEIEAMGFMYAFFNNAMIAMTFFIPLLGLGSAFMASYTTGAAMSAVANEVGSNAQILLAATILMPHSVIEFSAYSVALAENLVIMQKILSKKGLDNELGPFVASMVLVLALLVLGAVVEGLTAQLLTGMITQ